MGRRRPLLIASLLLFSVCFSQGLHTVPLVRKQHVEEALNSRALAIENYMRTFGEFPSADNRTDYIKVYGDLTRTAAYYIELQTGDGSAFSVDIDTGSADLVIYSDQCKAACDNVLNEVPRCTTTCARKANKYTVGVSAEYSPVPCTSCNTPLYHRHNYYCIQVDGGLCPFSISYLDNTGFRGGMVEDRVTFKDSGFTGKTALGLIFYQNDAKSFPPPEVEGILGLGFKNMASMKRSVLEDLEISMFALKLGKRNGYMTLNGVDPEMFTGDLTWVNIPADDRDHWSVDMQYISVGDIRTMVMSNAVVDSGSTHIILTSALYDRVCDALKDQSSSQAAKRHMNDLCDQKKVFLSPGAISSFPVINFEVSTSQRGISPGPRVTLPLSAEYYLRDIGGGYVLGISRLDKKKEQMVILGDTFLCAYYTAFDMEKRQIGFAHAIPDGDPPPVWLYLAVAVASLVSLTTCIFLCCICGTWVSSGFNWAGVSVDPESQKTNRLALLRPINRLSGDYEPPSIGPPSSEAGAQTRYERLEEQEEQG